MNSRLKAIAIMVALSAVIAGCVSVRSQTFTPISNPQESVVVKNNNKWSMYYTNDFNIGAEVVPGVIYGDVVELRYTSAVKAGYPPAELDLRNISVSVNGEPARIWSKSEALSALTGAVRRGDALGALSAGAAAVNASRTSGKYDVGGEYHGHVSDEYGNQYGVSGSYTGTVTDRDAQRRAAQAAAVQEARAGAAMHDQADRTIAFMEQHYAAEGVVQPGKFIFGQLLVELPKSFGKGSVIVVNIADVRGQNFTFEFAAD
ncbi:MAG: hypothetical protein ACRDHZ_16090 [Ktedonobacteraceae bacterium]